jgi:hypothetical protein
MAQQPCLPTSATAICTASRLWLLAWTLMPPPSSGSAMAACVSMNMCCWLGSKYLEAAHGGCSALVDAESQHKSAHYSSSSTSTKDIVIDATCALGNTENLT